MSGGGGLVDPQAFCGQAQAHYPHRWVTSGGTYAACSGKACTCPTHPTPPAALAALAEQVGQVASVGEGEG